LKTPGWYVWGGESNDIWYSWCFDFKNNTNFREGRNKTFRNRAFAVRSQQ
jgi:hypothetical protein